MRPKSIKRCPNGSGIVPNLRHERVKFRDHLLSIYAKLSEKTNISYPLIRTLTEIFSSVLKG